MMELDLEQFWMDDELAHRENCFSKVRKILILKRGMRKNIGPYL